MAAMFPVWPCQSIQDHEERATGQQQDKADHGSATQTDHHPAMSRAMANNSRAIIILPLPSVAGPSP